MPVIIRSSAILFIIILLGFSCRNQSQEPAQPNIVLILADDLGYGELGCYGQEIIETPNIDQLASEGMRFTQFYSGAPVCAPARCVILTGKHSGHAFIRGNHEWGERGDVWDFAKAVQDPGLEGQFPLPDSIITVAEIFKKQGYRTACVGKWGLGAPFTEGTAGNQGFDFFFGYNCQRQAHTYYPRHLWKNDEKVWLDNKLVVPGTRLNEGADPDDPASYDQYNLSQYAPELMLEETLGFLENNQDDPFFLYFATPIPHVPLQAPEKFVEKYRNKIGPEEPYLGDQGYFPNRTPRATYAAMVDYLDFQVGEIVEKIKELGKYENTIFLFTSDNGPTFAGGADSNYFNSAGPFKEERGWIKGSLHEGGIRVPLIVSWPGKIEPRTVSEHVSVFYDMMPTFLELTGIKESYPNDGISFLPELMGRTDQENHDFLYWEFPAYGGQQAVRMGKWKGLRENIREGNLEIQLFDLENDIQELHNIADEYPDVADRIREIMETGHITPAVERFRMEALD